MQPKLVSEESLLVSLLLWWRSEDLTPPPVPLIQNMGAVLSSRAGQKGPVRLSLEEPGQPSLTITSSFTDKNTLVDSPKYT